jgi:hypothetical protein
MIMETNSFKLNPDAFANLIEGKLDNAGEVFEVESLTPFEVDWSPTSNARGNMFNMSMVIVDKKSVRNLSDD